MTVYFLSNKTKKEKSMGCCGSKSVDSQNEVMIQKNKRRDSQATYKAHKIEISDYEYTYTYSDTGENI